MKDLDWVPAKERPDLVAQAVQPALPDEATVAEIDPDLADTARFCERYDVPLEMSANCVVIAARRGGTAWHAACMIRATDRADVNGVVRRHLEARKASFASMDEAVRLTRMEYGGITPLGLPPEWPVLVDEAVARTPDVVIGSGLRRSKIMLPGKVLAGLPAAEVISLALNHSADPSVK